MPTYVLVSHFRLWRRRALNRKQLREQRLLAAKAAFDTLSVGPPVQLNDYVRFTSI